MVEVADQVPPHILREYALLADGERGIVVGPRGDCCWMCMPSWDSPAVFASLLGGGGVYGVAPHHPSYVWGGHYEKGSLIWRSRWVTTGGIVECREALAFPGDPHIAVILRRIRALDETMRMRVMLDVRAQFGTERMHDLSCDDGVWTGRSGPHRFRWAGATKAQRGDDGSLQMIIDVAPGHDHDLVLELSDRELPSDAIRPNDAWRTTESAWAQAVPTVSGTIADDDTQTAYAVLRGLTSSSGGMVAAATMSLPERAEQGRNYDYRYCWIRDQCYAGQAVAVAGALPLLDDAVRFVSERVLTDGPRLKPAYCVTGSAPPKEQDLDLPGYPGAAVKTGNWVTDQFQLDAFGEALLLLAASARLDRLDTEHWRAVETLVDAIENRWREPDAGIWEVDDRRWAHSRLICAAGLRRIGDVAPARQGAQWHHLADRLITDVDSDCLHPSGRWQRAPDDPRVDAALLTPSIRGGLPTGDPRSIATLEAVRADLGRDGFVYRFQPDERPLGEAEGAFLLCGFLMALADHQQGNDLAAVRWFERNRTACGPPGLFTEEFDVTQRQLRGNLPQAFVHALLFEAAHRLVECSGPPVGTGTG
ncbi:glycoside hydrolase family 15 protein [Mycobacterium shimoidei]|uniref:glycoside hydrolase family 15 protein n=1 Tax=Mycobacterium shimoidei TaxID=29313 RepID=UPI0008490F9F|nr:glycoside hydrolase family 15 protein [Mycobacterium shimoidei]MCV7258068.1 glycoside hydrolase family 15 protein [Mycobacterium shimoidei]ODR12765.1 glycoside hydrolase [Mycobacterium shimoidei]ORW83485.1 glycoside hydrolase [Mycobacterium shimoidei]